MPDPDPPGRPRSATPPTPDGPAPPSRDETDEALAELFVLAASLYFRAPAEPSTGSQTDSLEAAVERVARVLLELSNGAVAGSWSGRGAVALIEGMKLLADETREAGRADLAERLDALAANLQQGGRRAD